MKLFLHIGTEKTGSSFLQTLLANNRKYLVQNGFHYPNAGKREADMIEGRISPGNGKKLFSFLIKGDFKSVKSVLFQYFSEAQKLQCDKILISNENLIEAFSIPQNFRLFIAIGKEIGFENIQSLLVLRDPVDQAISLYKHRAKNGTAPILEDWISHGYKLPTYLDNFFLLTNRIPEFNLRSIKYDSDGNVLGDRFFNGWLNINGLEINGNQRVNPSLTLSELELIREVNSKNPNLTFLFYSSLISLPKKDKSDDIFMKMYFNRLVGERLAVFNSLWQRCNKMLSANQQLLIPSVGDSIQFNEFTLSFSKKQLIIISEFLVNVNSFKFQFKIMQRNVKKIISKLSKVIK